MKGGLKNGSGFSSKKCIKKKCIYNKAKSVALTYTQNMIETDTILLFSFI